MAKYQSKLIPSKIGATSRVAIKLRDTYYTFEYNEEREIPPELVDKIDLDAERRILWDECHSQVDSQVEQILKAEKKMLD